MSFLGRRTAAASSTVMFAKIYLFICSFHPFFNFQLTGQEEVSSLTGKGLFLKNECMETKNSYGSGYSGTMEGQKTYFWTWQPSPSSVWPVSLPRPLSAGFSSERGPPPAGASFRFCYEPNDVPTGSYSLDAHPLIRENLRAWLAPQQKETKLPYLRIPSGTTPGRDCLRSRNVQFPLKNDGFFEL